MRDVIINKMRRIFLGVIHISKHYHVHFKYLAILFCSDNKEKCHRLKPSREQHNCWEAQAILKEEKQQKCCILLIFVFFAIESSNLCQTLMMASLVAQLVKNPPVMQETWVGSLGWEDSLEKGKATHSSILTWRIPWTSSWGCKEFDTTERLSLSLSCLDEAEKKHCISEINFLKLLFFFFNFSY